MSLYEYNDDWYEWQGHSPKQIEFSSKVVLFSAITICLIALGLMLYSMCSNSGDKQAKVSPSEMPITSDAFYDEPLSKYSIDSYDTK